MRRNIDYPIKKSVPKPTHENIESDVEAFIAAGGTVQHVEPGATGAANLLYFHNGIATHRKPAPNKRVGNE